MQLNPDCLVAFEKMKLGGGKPDVPRFIIYKISSDKKFIEIDYVAQEGEGFEALKEKLPDNDCRYVIYDATITTKSGVEVPPSPLPTHTPVHRARSAPSIRPSRSRPR